MPDQMASETEMIPTRLLFGPVGVARNGNAQHSIKQRERQTGHQPDLRIAQPQIILDRFGKDVDDLPVEEIEDVNDQQRPQQGAGRIAPLRRGGRHPHCAR
jgi:hypothetical protein